MFMNFRPTLLKHSVLIISASRYLVDILNIDNDYFEQIVNKLYPKELCQIKLIPLIMKHCLVMHLQISKDIIWVIYYNLRPIVWFGF